LGQIAEADDLIIERIQWKRDGLRVVFVHGVFDLLHPGHVRLLEQAKSLGDVLVVAVHGIASELSNSTATSAGPNARERDSSRMVTPAVERVEIIAALAAVDYAVLVDAVAVADLVAQLTPDVFVKGAFSRHPIPPDEELRAEKIVERAGGTVTIIPLEPGYSKNSLLERIRQAGA
jgi:rfaE bifunctional protein nucleotidyltransferase chain/domain